MNYEKPCCLCASRRWAAVFRSGRDATALPAVCLRSLISDGFVNGPLYNRGVFYGSDRGADPNALRNELTQRLTGPSYQKLGRRFRPLRGRHPPRRPGARPALLRPPPHTTHGSKAPKSIVGKFTIAWVSSDRQLRAWECIHISDGPFQGFSFPSAATMLPTTASRAPPSVPI
jgi:hypothetical protein